MRIFLSLVASGICYDDTAVKDMDAPKLHNWMKKLFRNEFSLLIRIETFSRPTCKNKDPHESKIDTDSSGNVEYGEVVSWIGQLDAKKRKAHANSKFGEYDHDGDYKVVLFGRQESECKFRSR